MRARIVYTKIWEDDWYCQLTRASKLLFLYLVTNSRIGMTGIYELSDRTACFDTGLNQSELDISKKELVKKVRFYQGWVFVINADKYNSFKGEKNKVAKEKEMKLVPKKIFSTLVSNKPDRVSGKGDSVSTNGDTSIINNHNHNHNHKSEYKSIDDLTEKEFVEIADKYGYPLAFVKSKYDDMVLWVGEKTGRGKGRNWRLTLMNWVKRDGLKIQQDYAKQNNEVAL